MKRSKSAGPYSLSTALSQNPNRDLQGWNLQKRECGQGCISRYWTRDVARATGASGTRGELVVLRSRNFNSLGLTGLNNTGDIAKELGDNSLRGPFSKQLCFCSHFPSLPDSDHHPSPAPLYLVLRIIFDTYSGRQKYCTLLHVQYLHNA